MRGRVWESETLLRAGRLASFEIVLDENSVSRRHAEVRARPDGSWAVRDLASTNGTFVNTARLAPHVEHPLKARDVLQFGKVVLQVELVDSTDGPPSDQMVVTASARSHADGVFPGFSPASLVPSALPDHAERRLRALFEAGKHLDPLQKEDDLYKLIVDSCVDVLDARRGAIVLADADAPPDEPRLERRPRSLRYGRAAADANGRFVYSKRLVNQCFAAGESRLYTDMMEEKVTSASISDGAMSSVICVHLHTPRKSLGVLHLDRGVAQAPFTAEDLHYAVALAAQVSLSIECAQLLAKQKDLYRRTTTTLAEMIDLRDDYTGGHAKRVTRYAELLATELGLSADQLEVITSGTALHDIGKVGIRDDILLAPGRLTSEQFLKMQEHTTIGARWLEAVAELREVIPIVKHHHEKWDGSGYPDRLAGEAIPLLARIVGVADAFDAMTSQRPYHESDRDRSAAAAFAELQRQAGRQFDPACVAAFVAIRDQVEREMPAPTAAAKHPPPRDAAGPSPAEITLVGDLSASSLPG